MTPKRRYRITENDQYAAFLRRVIRAYSRRVASGDIEAITTMAALADDLEDATRHAITGLRAFGYSWADIAMRLGITRQGAQQRWGDTPRTRHGHQQHPALTGAARDPTTSPMLALMPGTRQAPGTGANTGPRPPRTEHAYRQSCSCPACVLHFQFADERVFAGLHSAGYQAWLDHVWPAAACTRPIRLRGDISTSTRPPASCCAPSPPSACRTG